MALQSPDLYGDGFMSLRKRTKTTEEVEELEQMPSIDQNGMDEENLGQQAEYFEPMSHGSENKNNPIIGSQEGE